MSLFMSPYAIPLVAIIGAFTWLCMLVVVNGVRSIVRHRNEIELKQQLVDRGMTADEIERVVAATNIKSDHKW